MRESVDSLDTLVHARPGPGQHDRGPRPSAEEATARLALRLPVDRSGPAQETVVLGRYRLLERLGAGGFGVVWRAHDELLHREVAVKRISLGAGGDPIDSERATREALAGARLAHPAIVVLHEACAAEDAFYLISELIQGDTLAELIVAGELTDEELLEIGLALTEALDHAHARGVIHRDVKPQNVLVPHGPNERGAVAKLADFGGARLTGEDALTRTGDVLGTLAYMAPEQSEGREATEATDLYALALVLYEGFSGMNPVRGSSPAATARRIGARLTPLERRRGDLPAALTSAVDLALDPDPDRRGTLEDLHLALEETLVRGLRRPRRGRRRGHGRPASASAPPPGEATPTLDARPWEAAEVDRERDERIGDRRGNAEHDLDVPGEDLQEEGSTPRSRRLLLPRAVWLGCALAAVLWQVWVGHSGTALLLLAAAAPLLLLLPRRAGLGWLTAALAPVLGLAGLAGAFPAVAGQRTRLLERAALAALGYWWLTLVEPLLDRRLWLGAPAGTPARTVWEGSLGSAATHVVGPSLSLGVLYGAGVWAVAAALLPWVVRGRSAALDVVAAAAWSVALLVAWMPSYAGLSVSVSSTAPYGAVLAALLGAAIAVLARALRGPV
jgi:eukaryotic-like serine/threonine-protein kinase